MPSTFSFVSLLARVPYVRFGIVGCLFTAHKTNSSHVRRVAVTTWHAIRSKGVNARFMFSTVQTVANLDVRHFVIAHFDFNAVVSTFRDWFRRIRMRPTDWRVAFAQSAAVQITLSTVQLSVMR